MYGFFKCAYKSTPQNIKYIQKTMFFVISNATEKGHVKLIKM